MSVHPRGCDCGKYACSLRAKGVLVSPRATPTSARFDIPPNNNNYNSWEKGKAVEKRANGTEMPILDKHGSTIPIKKYVEQHRHTHEETKRRRASQP